MKNNFPHALWWLVILCTGCIQQAPQSFVQRTGQEDTGLRFLVSADPQYHWKDMLDGSSSVINADQVAQIAHQKILHAGYAGYIIAGDLTHHALDVELDRSIRGQRGRCP